jgi:hypothetical protein
MTQRTGQRRTMAGWGLAAATAVLAVGTALAHGGYGPGDGAGCGAGYGPGPAAGAQGYGPGCGAYRPGAGPGGPGLRHGMGGWGAGLLTDEERAAHRAKMQSLASYDECKTYMADFSQQLQARAKEKGTAIGGPNAAVCDRMQAHGRFTQ